MLSNETCITLSDVVTDRFLRQIRIATSDNSAEYNEEKTTEIPSPF